MLSPTDPTSPRAPGLVESIYSKQSEEPKAACQRKPTGPLALSSTERPHKKPFACLPTALRPSGPVQQRIFHQGEKELTSLAARRYNSGHRKGRLKIRILDGPGSRLPLRRACPPYINQARRTAA